MLWYLSKRLWEGTGAQAKHKRASWVREMDEAWNLTQLEKGKKNSKIRDRQPRDIEKEIVDRGEYSYKNNLRELIHLAINEGHPKNMEQFKKLLASYRRKVLNDIDTVCGDMNLIDGVELSLETIDGHGAHLKMSHDNNIDRAWIPINYCPICGRNLRKDV